MPSLFGFYKVAEDEAATITKRRTEVARLYDPQAEVSALGLVVRPMHQDGQEVRDERGERFPDIVGQTGLVGLALSGGGIRSASFCLGVLQGLDAVVDDGKPQILDAVDYLSTVSGGGYLGASYVAGARQNKAGHFPFASKLDQLETIGTQHLRDFSNFLVPAGALDFVTGGLVVARGLLINALLVLGALLPLAALTVALLHDEKRLHAPGLGAALDHGGLFWRGSLAALVLALCAAGAVLSTLTDRRGAGRPRLDPGAADTLAARERVGRRASVVTVGLLIAGFAALQPVVLRALFDAAHLGLCPTFEGEAGLPGRALHQIGIGAGGALGSLAAVTAAFWASGSKLAKIVQTTFGDHSLSGALAHWGGRIAIGVGAVAVPLALWAAYLSLSFVALRWWVWPGAAAACRDAGPAALPGWIPALGLTPGALPLVYVILGLFFAVLAMLTPPNANSLHGFYRDRLSRAFLWDTAELRADARRRDRAPSPWLDTLVTPPRRHHSADRDAADRTKLSGLATPAPGSAEVPAPLAQPTPFLLLNSAVNLEGSRYANRRGRNADSFTFSPLHVGSSATGYVATETLERADPHLDLATAMAISGAAASANMGASTIRPLTFGLALLNIRLGYWLPNPRRLARRRAETAAGSAPVPAPASEASPSRRLIPPRRIAMLWPVSFLMEALGRLDEWSSLVYLTDGGHFDNLGLYELLRRRCRVIVVADAEADPQMNFESFVRLQRYARIDLGVRIDLPWEELRRWSRGITVEAPHGPKDDLTACVGPHVAVGRIEYGRTDPGVLIYIKSCITGDENDLVRDYRRRNPDFPHETTLDQFFTEEQFEVYRALGFHATNSFFSGQDRFGFRPSHADATWPTRVQDALTRLNVPQAAVARIMAQQAPRPPRCGGDAPRPGATSEPSAEPPGPTCRPRTDTDPLVHGV